jgi:ElaB/YqjD/DUF883 family membrane-anchored ribosome-binding protein
MTTMDNVRDRAGDAKDQIEKLRQQVEALMNERVSPALADAAGRVESAARSGVAMARDQKEAVSSRVREQPMIAVAIAAVAGFLLGRLFR